MAEAVSGGLVVLDVRDLVFFYAEGGWQVGYGEMVSCCAVECSEGRSGDAGVSHWGREDHAGFRLGEL